MKDTEKSHQFRQKIYQNFTKRADTVLNLLDALSSNEHASSVVELSLNPAFERSYTALFKAINEVEINPSLLSLAISEHLPKPSTWPFWLFAVDVTSYPRQFSKTLEDCSVVYQPNQVKKNKPITFGHRDSTVSLIPPKELTGSPWRESRYSRNRSGLLSWVREEKNLICSIFIRHIFIARTSNISFGSLNKIFSSPLIKHPLLSGKKLLGLNHNVKSPNQYPIAFNTYQALHDWTD